MRKLISYRINGKQVERFIYAILLVDHTVLHYRNIFPTNWCQNYSKYCILCTVLKTPKFRLLLISLSLSLVNLEGKRSIFSSISFLGKCGKLQKFRRNYKYFRIKVDQKCKNLEVVLQSIVKFEMLVKVIEFKEVVRKMQSKVASGSLHWLKNLQ